MSKTHKNVVSKDGETWQRPDSRVRSYWTLKGIIPITFAAIVLSMLASGFQPEAIVNFFFLLWVLMILLLYLWAVFFYWSYVYSIRRDGVHIKRGIFFKSDRIIPFERIQHITVTKGPLMMLYGISDLNIFTAGTGSMGSSAASRGMFGSEGFIPGLTDPKPLRQEIMKRIQLSRSGAGLGDEVHDGPITSKLKNAEMGELIEEVREEYVIF